MRALLRIAAPLVAVAALTSCDDSGPTAPEVQLRRLNAAESAWRAARLANYRFVATHSCFCPLDYIQPKLVTVRGGVVTGVFDPRDDRAYPLDWRQPMDSLFALIRREARERPDRLEVVYDAQLGYPRSIAYGEPERDAGGGITVDSLRADP